MNRILWIFGIFVSASACMATLLNGSQTDNTAGTFISQKSTSVPIAVESLVGKCDTSGVQFEPAGSVALSEVWDLAQRSSESFRFVGVYAPNKTASRVSLLGTFDLGADSLPTLSECTEHSESSMIANSSVSNFGISHLSIQSSLR